MADDGGTHRLGAVRRGDDRVMPLELFFDLVFVLAFTQCSALMAHAPTWTGVAQGMLVLAVLWWSWVGYAWLTSVVDPEEGAVRIVMVAAMAGLLVTALCVPEAFGDLALTLAISYGVVRAAHIALFVLASRDDPALRRSVTGLAVSTAIGVGLLFGAAFLDGMAQGAVWVLAVALDAGGPFVFGSEGWRIEPGHFAERHGLVIIIALGESIVALGVAADVGLAAEVVAAVVLGVALSAAMWWLYFDVGALLIGRALAALGPGREQNELARDAYSYLHFPMVAAIVLVALGLESTVAHADRPLHTVPAFALVGGVGIYLLGHVAFKYRGMRRLSVERLVMGVGLLAVWPLAREVDALAALTAVSVVLWALVAYETARYADARAEIRHRPES